MSFLTSPRRIDAAMDVPPDPRQPMTPEQEQQLRDLSERAGETFDAELTLWQAERRIAALADLAGTTPPGA
ncbi:DUF3072 domain-containing protein [Salipiger mangrovisoli]|uniref:DUF3072 domain-containing protein n=1 Tax=Salipiger mangrovisoli TaxID=2865933 RepID=A0ABR9XB84_9RHOB|nr:DUF3072 domain-containing protein [Salipiger mangrovisoli]MBE9640682.1 DUF3072 domain-containing protein [Salipiger mangrovisoli]